MMDRSKTRHTTIVLCCLAFAAGIAISQTKPDPPAPRPQHADKHASDISSDRGERVFRQNCARCHNPPESFPPSISGTVALHMRVRADLSERDYKSLLKYLNQ
ncbi:MAG TPA: cytochrome c [Acidobacteriaceae bacterium]|nr:cytochrome c [Acidobacteriaceae bacterium]